MQKHDNANQIRTVFNGQIDWAYFHQHMVKIHT